MGLILHREAYAIESTDLCRVLSKVNGKETKFSLQCFQSKEDSEIETLIVNQLIAKGYTVEELTPINWE